ncbi:MAG: hypothetical protein COV10_02955 [Candidatus Vogelbacteria bacterium CG10_big_fil_rev_8_21_14_0_10_51_16]|uniref:Segregation and condensation protein A n=1 Tax=Candidatus Vogelbacteria bacterium CG10_big_fil_rev_8_21_14_0_10_51_16 TaxID=1975045 RepID=A0A2H0RE70_9BACT|nr:MAG: hypothetical protein COV10_02955 [Candidatus Vogelbacteria bacterium CG10_big_fil_rev_8_21_14_0_10_51_16]
MEEEFNVTVGDFSGPLDLVLKLVQERKMLVNDLSLAAIADSFIEHLEAHSDLPLATTANFILVASTLLLIKSRSLIPEFSLTKEEEQDVVDLENRLAVYQIVRDAAITLDHLQKSARIYVGAPLPQMVRFSPPKKIGDHLTCGLGEIREIIVRLINELPNLRSIPEAAIEKIANLNDVMEDTLARLQSALSMRFNAHRRSKGVAPLDTVEKKRIIVSFLALLELARRGLVALSQKDHFNDIEVATAHSTLPNYT